jgi:hypothetical protein
LGLRHLGCDAGTCEHARRGACQIRRDVFRHALVDAETADFELSAPALLQSRRKKRRKRNHE